MTEPPIKEELLPVIVKAVEAGNFDYTSRRSLIIYAPYRPLEANLEFNAIEIKWVELKPPKATKPEED